MINMPLSGQIVLVTGASRGIGWAIAECFARNGAVVIGTSTTENGATKISNLLKSIAENNSRGEVLDVNDAIATVNLIEKITSEIGPISILVNNAGITRDQLAIRMKDEDWDSVIATNLTAVARLSRIIVRSMLKAKFGRIINITSIVGFVGNAGQINYSAAKAGLAGMSRALAREVASRNITVNCIAPGFIKTDMTDNLSDQQINALISQVPVGRFGSPEDIAEAAKFIALPSSAYITGTTIHVNGGMYM